MFHGSNHDRKSKLSGILTEPLYPRESSVNYIQSLRLNLTITLQSHPFWESL